MFQLSAFGIGATIGTGIFVLSEAVPIAGPAVIWSFVIAGVVVGLTAVCYAELAGAVLGLGLVLLVRLRGPWVSWSRWSSPPSACCWNTAYPSSCRRLVAILNESANLFGCASRSAVQRARRYWSTCPRSS
ncbi:MAG: hypothetical protein U0R72_05510 [Nakamurella multipartita]